MPRYLVARFVMVSVEMVEGPTPSACALKVAELAGKERDCLFVHKPGIARGWVPYYTRMDADGRLIASLSPDEEGDQIRRRLNRIDKGNRRFAKAVAVYNKQARRKGWEII